MDRIAALAAARVLFGDLGMISSGEDTPKMVWMIGNMDKTLGKGKTWDEAVSKATAKAAKLPKQEVVRVADAG